MSTRLCFYSLLCVVTLFSSCNSYRQNIMFQVEESSLREMVDAEERNYLLKSGDQIQLDVYSNGGELIVDPNYQLRQELGAGMMSKTMVKPTYIIQPGGKVKFPMIDTINVLGKTKFEVDSMLSISYSQFYVDAYVLASVVNRRVVVLGATGGKIVLLENENMNLLEVLALAGGLENYAKAHNIRVIRGDLKNPEVEVIDLSTIEGMKRASLKIQPNDVIYVEPVRKVISEGIRDIAPVISLLTSLMTLLILISRT